LVEGRNGISLEATRLLSDVAGEDFEAVILPGGPGIQQLRGDERIISCLRRQHAAGRLIAAICAGPLLLLDAGLTEGIAYTAHPSTLEELREARNQAVVTDGPIITSRGAGTATEFALALVRALRGQDAAREIADSICWSH
jgi:4-methyl-5(b-hydroxyethyl)-thiazole monophosphate biosynthesis